MLLSICRILQTQRQSNFTQYHGGNKKKIILCLPYIDSCKQKQHGKSTILFSFLSYILPLDHKATVLLHNYKNLKIYQCVFVIFYRLLLKFTLHLIRSRNVQNQRQVLESDDHFRNIKNNIKFSCLENVKQSTRVSRVL